METPVIEAPPAQPARWWLAFSLSVAGFVAALLLAWALVVWLERAGMISAVRERGGVLAPLVLVAIHAVVSVSPAPGETVAIANSAIYGFGWGVLMNWSGWMLGAVLEFALVRGAVKSLARREIEPAVPAWLRRLPAGHPLFLIAARWVPMGAHIVNISAAAKATLWRHVWCSAISIMPIAVLFSALANGWRLFW
jgi:uncharacterized membrane protein YdjX (TVP38/TMEM64 family)